jgi:transketolase
LSTGSLGHGVCVAAGMALASKISGAKYRVYAIVGDGECEEGSIWEMALFAAHWRLGNFTVIIDHNRMQAMGFCEREIGLDDIESKWRAFGWNVISVDDGNDVVQLGAALSQCDDNRPNVVVAYTVKGKGVSYMENELLWHYRDPQGEWYEKACLELKEGEV